MMENGNEKEFIVRIDHPRDTYVYYAHDHLHSRIHTVQASPFWFTQAWTERKLIYILRGGEGETRKSVWQEDGAK